MGGQDAEGFDQREDQARNDHEGDVAEGRSHHARHEQQGQERRHRRQDREDDRLGDLSRADDRPAHAVPALVLASMDVLAHDDGVVDHDPEHHDEGEQRRDADRNVERRQQRERAEERDRYAQRDPQGEAPPDDEGQRGEDDVAVGGARDVEHALIRPLTAPGATPLHGRAGGTRSAVAGPDGGRSARRAFAGGMIRVRARNGW